MFHSAKAILFFDGYREKSHFSIARYLEIEYCLKDLLENKWIGLLDYYRDFRNNDQYSTSFYTTDDGSEKSLKNEEIFF